MVTIGTIAIIAITAHGLDGHFARDIHRKPPLKSSVCTEWGWGLGLGLGLRIR